ncbi:MAG: hypothetical protein INH41_31615 [Myxococcaceae bacterium]|jgi:hypothetical protein|nr:hypothetical protein [Myxococcaceae bacterium]
MIRLVTTAALTLATLAVAGDADLRKAAAGRWRSEAAEDMGNGSFCTRDFTFKGGAWQLTFTIYADKELKTPLLALDLAGPWATGKASEKVPGATEATFDFTSKKVTLRAKDVAKNFGMDGCGLEVGKAKDVSKTGCSFVAPVAQYGREFDLLKVDGAAMWLGARPADGNMGAEDKRPTALGAKLVRAK